MTMTKKTSEQSIIDFHEVEDFSSSTKKPATADVNNQLAILTQYLHNYKNSCEDCEKVEVAGVINAIFKDKLYSYQIDTKDDNILRLAEDPMGYGLFDDFYNVPFANPQLGTHTFIDLFAGIGGIRLPFSELGYRCVFSSEWDQYAQQTYMANFGEMPFGDITKEAIKRHIPKHFDILLAGFPCQAFSIMGKMKGFDDIRGTMFFEVATILSSHKPEVILLENVKQLTTHDHGKTFSVILGTLKDLGYNVKWSILNALDFGLPQKRERVIIVGFRNKKNYEKFNFEFEKKPYNLNDILEPDDRVSASLFISDRIFAKRKKQIEGKKIFYPSIWHENKAGNVSILDYACALRTGASYNYLLVNGRRRPSSRELLRLQGFPDSYKVVVSHGEIRKQTGNSVAVPMIRAIAKKIDNILNNM